MSLVNKMVRKIAHTQSLIGVKDRIGRRLRETYYNAEVLLRIQDKIAPLQLAIKPAEPERINLLLPEIDFRTFYGGYIAKFNLAKKLTDAGYKVRFVIVDPCHIDEPAWRAGVSQYDGLEKIFDRVEYVHLYDRKQTLSVSPNDRVIATTWWTAYIADALVKQLGIKHFLYLIQEYEPFTFPMGSYHAIAHESYSFAHRAVFSSPQLQDYFRQSKIGIYSGQNWCEPEKAMPFENAILSYSPQKRFQGRTKDKYKYKLLFYARPEAHAARNMFEVAYLALSQAITQGIFNEGKWEFHGIGSTHGDIPLPKGHHLKMIGKFGLKEYKDRLLAYDIGLSLMYTPHPSLLPMEMAAAGMWVVTNACENKTAEVLKTISSNLIGSQATIEGVTKGLGVAVENIDDLKARESGTNVNWATDWDAAFSADKVKNIIDWLHNN